MEIENQEHEIEAVETQEDQVEPEIETQEETTEEPEQPEYQPNFKYRVGDDEHEFDERIKGVIRSKEDEDFYRDLVTKAQGLELVKRRSEEKETRWKQTESEFSGLRSQHERVQNTLQKLNQIKDQDFGTFQKAWQIPDQSVLKRAAEILKTHDDPDARDQLERSYQDRLQMLQYEDRVNTDTQHYQMAMKQLHDVKMHTALQSPEIKAFASEFDRRVGEHGAFMKEVNQLGSMYHYQGGYEDPQVVVAQTYQRLSKLIGPLTTPASAPAQAPAPKPVQRPTLPNLGSGRTGTAVSKKPRTIEDLRKLADSF